MMTHDDFVATMERFLADSGMSASQFGLAAMGDYNFVRQVRAGRSPSLKNAERVINYINAAGDYVKAIRVANALAEKHAKKLRERFGKDGGSKQRGAKG